jgi:hypothetical protein
VSPKTQKRKASPDAPQKFQKLEDLPDALTCPEVSGVLRCTTGALAVRRHRRKSALPFFRDGKKVLYLKTDVIKYLESNKDPGIGPKPVPKLKRRSPRKVA